MHPSTVPPHEREPRLKDRTHQEKPRREPRDMESSDSPLTISSSPNPTREMREEESEEEEEEEEEIHWRGRRDEEPWPRKRREVMLEGYVDAEGGGEQAPNGVARTKSLTDDDLEELKGCLDLGFGFSYEEIPDLCNTLPALELCYSMSQRFLDEKQQHNRSIDRSSSGESLDLSALPPSPPVANWKFSSPGKRVSHVPSLFLLLPRTSLIRCRSEPKIRFLFLNLRFGTSLP
ncbi:hypothetical protein BHM03_00043193 [Ensete ventricosum]|nr:hypothetical protein BHM03_00043193 [Ensete ventricosum]